MVTIKVYFIRFSTLLAESDSIRFYLSYFLFLCCFGFGIGSYLIIELYELKF